MVAQATFLARLSATAALAVAARTVACRVGRTWGATPDEAGASLPGDNLVPEISSQVTMAIDIDAIPETVWPWLLQMGIDRAGLYTHLWVENGLLHLGARNANTIQPQWQDLEVGDHIWFARQDYPGPQFGPLVTELEPNRSLICRLGDDAGQCIGTWQFVLKPVGESTRLIFRSRAAASRSRATKVFDVVAEPGYLYMDAGMLQGIRRRAESMEQTRLAALSSHSTRVDEMPLKVLIAVASQQGSTRQIASALAAALRLHHIIADVRDIHDNPDSAAYDAVVVGSAIHTHHWMRAAQGFVQQHSGSLKGKPVWLFSVGMLTVDRAQPWPEPYPLDRDRHLQMTGARDHVLFTGRRTLNEPQFLWKLAAQSFHLTLGDFRDWDRVYAWGEQIATILQAESIRHVA